MEQIKIVEDPEFIKCLLDDTRRKMVIEMMREPTTISQMAKNLGKTPATIHYHIKKLCKIGVVKLVKTKMVNRNLVEKYYQAILPAPIILGFNQYNQRGPVPPKNYSEKKIRIELDENDIETAISNLNLSIIPERKKEFVEDVNEILSALSLYSTEVFRGVCQQLDVNIPANCSDKLEGISATLPVLALFQILDEPKFLSILQRLIQSIKID
jgi:DNA-binding transcriptional ArsR family regulator